MWSHPPILKQKTDRFPNNHVRSSEVSLPRSQMELPALRNHSHQEPWRADSLPLRRSRQPFAFRAFSDSSLTVRRSLARRTKIAAPACNDDPLDRAAASKTFLSSASVGPMVLLIISRLPFRVNEV